MDLTQIPLFKALHERMSWLSQRQELLAQNVANGNTPGYQPRDLKPLDFKQMLGQSPGQLPLAVTQPGQMTGTLDAAGFGSVPDKQVTVAQAGNGVSLEDEMFKVSTTASEYQLTTGLYRQHYLMLKAALGP